MADFSKSFKTKRPEKTNTRISANKYSKSKKKTETAQRRGKQAFLRAGKRPDLASHGRSLTPPPPTPAERPLGDVWHSRRDENSPVSSRFSELHASVEDRPTPQAAEKRPAPQAAEERPAEGARVQQRLADAPERVSIAFDFRHDYESVAPEAPKEESMPSGGMYYERFEKSSKSPSPPHRGGGGGASPPETDGGDIHRVDPPAIQVVVAPAAQDPLAETTTPETEMTEMTGMNRHEEKLTDLHKEVTQIKESLVSLTNANNKSCVVARLDTASKNRFVRKVMLALIIQFSATILITWVLTKLYKVQTFGDAHPFVVISLVAFLALLWFTFSMFGRLSDYGTATQVTVLVVSTCGTAVLFSLFVHYSEWALFVESLGLSAIILFTILLFTLQTRYQYQSLGGALWVLLIMLVAGYFFVYLPQSDFFAHPSVEWVDNMDRGTLHVVFLIALTTAFTIYILYDFEQMIRHQTSQDVLYVAWRLNFDIVIFILLTINSFLHFFQNRRQAIISTSTM